MEACLLTSSSPPAPKTLNLETPAPSHPQDGEIWEAAEEDPTAQRTCSAPFRISPYMGKYTIPGTTPNAVQVSTCYSLALVAVAVAVAYLPASTLYPEPHPTQAAWPLHGCSCTDA